MPAGPRDVYKRQGIKQQHVLLANPPYVTTEEMKGLSREVKREPEMALWGGDDGLTFYRAILSYWSVSYTHLDVYKRQH